MKVQGTVAKILNVNGGFYKIKIENDAKWYGCGKKAPSINEGDFISFECTVSQNGKYTNYDVQFPTLKILEKPKSAPVPSSDITKDQYWKNKEERDIARDRTISYAAARNAAIEVAVAALQAGILPTKGTKKQDQFDQFVEIISQQTETFFKEVSDTNYIEGILTDTEKKQVDSYVDNADFDDDISF